MRRTLAAVVLVCLALLAAACRSDEPSAAPAPALGDDGGVPVTSPDEGEIGSVPPAESGGPSGTDQTPSTVRPPETTTTSAQPPEPGPVGSFAAFYLRPSESATIVLSVHAHEGAAPRRTTLDHLASVLEQVSGKAVDVSLNTLQGDAEEWTSDEVRALGDAHGPAQSRDAAVLRLFFLRGSYAESDTVVGVAVRSDVAAVFPDKVAEAAGLLGNGGAVEDAVTMHEMGHILGLVDVVLDTGREDPEHPGHSRNEESVMYYAVESTLLPSILAGGPPRDFDQADLDDLATIRNG